MRAQGLQAVFELKETERLHAAERRAAAHKHRDSSGEASTELAHALLSLLQLHAEQELAAPVAPTVRLAGTWDEPEHAAPRTTLGDLWPTHPTNDGSIASQLSPTYTRQQAERIAEDIAATSMPAVAADVAAMMRGERPAEAIPALFANAAKPDAEAPHYSDLFPEPPRQEKPEPCLRVACYASVGTEISLAPFASLVANAGDLPQVKLYAPVVLGPRHMEFVEVSATELADPQASGLDFLARPARRTRPPEGRRYESCTNLDVILVPGLAFTPAGDRLGYGGGFYDAYLSMCRAQVAWAGRDMGSWPQPRPARRARAIGVGYKSQVVDVLPLSFNDQRVDELLVV